MRFNHVKSRRYGAILWIASLQYFLVQGIVIAAWTVPHSFANNYISDLGNTECGMYAGLAVCSPLWPLMNGSFIVYGITMALGAMLLRSQFISSRFATAAFGLMVLSGVGTILVGLFPENTIGFMHATGAFLGLGIGNLSVLLIGLFARPLPRWLSVLTIMSAVISLTAFALFLSEIYLGLGRGGMERVVSYTFTVWMIGFGTYILVRKEKRPFRALNS